MKSLYYITRSKRMGLTSDEEGNCSSFLYRIYFKSVSDPICPGKDAIFSNIFTEKVLVQTSRESSVDKYVNGSR